MQRRFDAISGAGYPYFVAEVTTVSSGYAYASAYRTRPGYRFTVEDSSTSRAAQGQGVGEALLDEWSSGARRWLPTDDRGDRRLRATGSLSPCTAEAGLPFFGTIHSVGFKFGRWLDSVVMELPLGEGDRSTPAERSK